MKTLTLPAIALPCAGFVAALLVGLQGPGTVLAEHSNSGVDLVAVDPNIQGNTATSLGSRETCLRVDPGATVQVDVTVDQVPADRPMSAFQFELIYDPAIVTVTRSNNAMLLATNEDFNPVGLPNDPLPDSDGSFLVAVADFSSGLDTGRGVLSRITLKAVGQGVTNLSPHRVLVLDDRNEGMIPKSLGAAYLAVGEACPSAPPTPVTEPPPGSVAPGETPEAESTPQAGETPGAQTGETPTTGKTPAAGTTPSLGGTPPMSPEPGSNSSATANEEEADGDGGLPGWIAAPIVAGVVVLLGAGYRAVRWRRRPGS